MGMFVTTSLCHMFYQWRCGQLVVLFDGHVCHYISVSHVLSMAMWTTCSAVWWACLSLHLCVTCFINGDVDNLWCGLMGLFFTTSLCHMFYQWRCGPMWCGLMCLFFTTSLCCMFYHCTVVPALYCPIGWRQCWERWVGRSEGERYFISSNIANEWWWPDSPQPGTNPINVNNPGWSTKHTFLPQRAPSRHKEHLPSIKSTFLTQRALSQHKEHFLGTESTFPTQRALSWHKEHFPDTKSTFLTQRACSRHREYFLGTENTFPAQSNLHSFFPCLPLTCPFQCPYISKRMCFAFIESC